MDTEEAILRALKENPQLLRKIAGLCSQSDHHEAEDTEQQTNDHDTLGLDESHEESIIKRNDYTQEELLGQRKKGSRASDAQQTFRVRELLPLTCSTFVFCDGTFTITKWNLYTDQV